MKDKIISFIWQHILLLISLYVMTLGVAVCVRSQLGSSVISTIRYGECRRVYGHYTWVDHRHLHNIDERHIRGGTDPYSKKKL